MSISDEITLQKEKFKGMTFVEKFKYIMYYYKWWILILAFVICFFSVELFNIFSDKPDALNCIIVNASTFESKPAVLYNDYLAYTEYDTNNLDIVIDSSYIIDFNNSSPLAYNNAERIMNKINENSLDVIICPEDIANEYMEKGYLDEMVDITSFERFITYNLYTDRGPVYYCILKDAPHPKAISEFLEFLNYE